MATLGEAVLYLLTDNSKLEAGLGDAEQKTESASAGMAKALGGAIVAGAAVAGSAIIAIGSQAFDMASQVDAATDQIGASLGVGVDEAKAYGETIKSIYGNNFGDSIEDVGKSVEVVAKQLKLAGNDPSLKKITENAYRLRDVFGTDIGDSIDAVKTLMQNFGVTADEAFDHLTAGYQAGLDRSGDFLDTIGEYSVQFAEGGASMTEFFSALDTGLQGGVLGTDKAADAFKEFRVRIQDGSTLTAQSLAMIGLSADDITSKLADGSMTVKDAWDLVQRALIQTTDTSKQFQAGVGLIGTQFEDMGAKAILAMDLTDDWAEGGLKATSDLDSKYTNLGSTFEGMWRQFQVGIEPAGEALLALVNENLPAIQGAVALASGAIVHAANGLVDGIAEVKRLWNENWAGIRTTWENFAKELPEEQKEFWRAWHQAFDAGSEENSNAWEEFFSHIFTGFTRWLSTLLELATMFLLNWHNTTVAWHALLKGDWSTFWESIGENFTNAFGVLISAIDIFDQNFKENMVGALQGTWDSLKDIWKGFSEWWNSSFGALLGQLTIQAPETPFANVNPFNVPSTPGSGGGGGFGSGGVSAQSAGGINVTQHFYGQTDPVTVKEASQDGVQRAARTLGMR